jgi:hypothetical protein
MAKRIQECTKEKLISIPLPSHGSSYTVISHEFIIDYTSQALANAGFAIVDEEYKCTADGQIAQGVYKLQYSNDSDLTMMFAWTNSYNKLVKFKCLIGAHINANSSVMTSGTMGTWSRRHIGTADVEAKQTIDDQISNAHMYYQQMVNDKNVMQDVILNKRKQAQLLGVLFAEYGILTTEQASLVRSQMDKPLKIYSNPDSLWTFYNHVTVALQYSHPRTWMEDQRILHYFIGTICDFSTPPPVVSTPVPDLTEPVDPLTTNYGEPENQTNLLVQIAEVTGDDSVLKPNLPVEPAHDEIVQYTDPVGNTFELPTIDIPDEEVFAEEDNLSITHVYDEPEEEKVDLSLLPPPNNLEPEVDKVSEFDLFLDEDKEEQGFDDVPDFF